MNRASIALILFLASCSGGNQPQPPQSSGWQDYGGSEPTINGYSFAFPGPSGVAGYFFKYTPSQVEQTVTLNYSISGNNPVWAQHVQSDGSSDNNPASIMLFLWRAGDDLGGGTTGKASYRFWCPTRALLTVGNNQTLSCKLDGNVWTNVSGFIDPNGFAAAVQNQRGLGFSFGGAQFYGHGVYLQGGSAVFTINSLTVQ